MSRGVLVAAVVVVAAVAAVVLLLQPRSPPLDGLVFISEASGVSQVHVLLNGEERALTTGPRAHFPMGSAGGRVLVVESHGEGDDHVERLLWVALDGGVLELHGEARRARSPVAGDGFVIAESSRAGFSDLWRIPLDGGAAVQLTHDEEGCFEPQLTKGPELVFTSSHSGDPELYAMPLDGGERRRLTTNPAEDLAPRVSPSGEHVVFVSSRGGTDALYLVPRAGGDAKPLHAQPLERATTAGPLEDVERDALWSRDGREVIFTARTGGGHLRLWAVEAATGKARALTDGAQDDDQPALSADGTWVVFARGPVGKAQLWAVPYAGGQARQLTSGQHARWLPRWMETR